MYDDAALAARDRRALASEPSPEDIEECGSDFGFSEEELSELDARFDERRDREL